jgi:hypothetical protein
MWTGQTPASVERFLKRSDQLPMLEQERAGQRFAEPGQELPRSFGLSKERRMLASKGLMEPLGRRCEPLHID